MKKIELKKRDLITFYVYTITKDLKDYIKFVDRKTLKTIKDFNGLIFESYNNVPECIYLFPDDNIKNLDKENLNPFSHGLYNNVFSLHEIDIIIKKELINDSENDYYVRSLSELKKFLGKPYKFYFTEDEQKVYKEENVEIIEEDEIPF